MSNITDTIKKQLELHEIIVHKTIQFLVDEIKGDYKNLIKNQKISDLITELNKIRFNPDQPFENSLQQPIFIEPGQTAIICKNENDFIMISEAIADAGVFTSITAFERAWNNTTIIRN